MVVKTGVTLMSIELVPATAVIPAVHEPELFAAVEVVMAGVPTVNVPALFT